MAVKSFIRGDFRTLIVDNDYPTNYKVYYNGKWNYIQDEESFVNKLNPDLGESYLNRFNLKVLDNNQWVPLAILENYYNKNEKRNSIFYRIITKENFIFKPRAVNFTEVDARLGLNNLQTPFASNEIKYNEEVIEEITDKIQKDEVLYKLSTSQKSDDYIIYNLNNEQYFDLENNHSLENYIECKQKFYSNVVNLIKFNNEQFEKDKDIIINKSAFLKTYYMMDNILLYDKSNFNKYNINETDLKRNDYNSCVNKMVYYRNSIEKVKFNSENFNKDSKITTNSKSCFISYEEV